MNEHPRDALDELALRAQWVGWNLEPPLPGKTKARKVPYSATTGYQASTTDSATWADFETVLRAVVAHGWTGAGFVFSAADPYAGIDLDGCRVAATGDIAAWAQTIIAGLGSYTELSPSGTGVHIIVRAAVPLGGNRRGAVELYDHARYFTVTGDRLPEAPPWIADAQGALDALHREIFGADELVMQPRASVARARIEPNDADLLRRMFDAANGDRIRRLWDGDLSRFGGDESAADFALCSHLAFWAGGDRNRADALFRQSGLYRTKWDEKRGQTTYGARTLARAGNRPTVVRGAIAL